MPRAGGGDLLGAQTPPRVHQPNAHRASASSPRETSLPTRRASHDRRKAPQDSNAGHADPAAYPRPASDRFRQAAATPERRGSRGRLAYFASGFSSANFPLAAGAITRRRNALTRTPSPSIRASACSTPAGAVSSAT